MKIFESMANSGHEQVVLCHDEATNLRAVIAIHNTILGPALGGCRMWPFESEEEAIQDALRLSQGMTYKNAAAGLDLGGGKAVIIGDPKKDKSKALFRAFGKFVQSLSGKYLTAEDVGMTVKDMEYIKLETDFVTGLPEKIGGSGDPSPFTALGVFEGIKASVKHKLKQDDLNNITVAVQGIGNVGKYLCRMLHEAGANLIVTDIFKDKLKEVERNYNARIVTDQEIYSVNADVFAPCALGAIINDDSIHKINFKIIAGGANNQLLDEKKHSEILKDRDILYAPDFIINSGGVINISFEIKKEYNPDKAIAKVKNINNILVDVFNLSENENITTSEAATRLAEKRINAKKNVYE